MSLFPIFPRLACSNHAQLSMWKCRWPVGSWDGCSSGVWSESEGMEFKILDCEGLRADSEEWRGQTWKELWTDWDSVNRGIWENWRTIPNTKVPKGYLTTLVNGKQKKLFESLIAISKVGKLGGDHGNGRWSLDRVQRMSQLTRFSWMRDSQVLGVLLVLAGNLTQPRITFEESLRWEISIDQVGL